MSTAEKIAEEIQALMPEDQSEVLDFVKFIKSREIIREERQLKEFSLENAMRGMEGELDLYDLSDIRMPIG